MTQSAPTAAGRADLHADPNWGLIGTDMVMPPALSFRPGRVKRFVEIIKHRVRFTLLINQTVKAIDGWGCLAHGADGNALGPKEASCGDGGGEGNGHEEHHLDDGILTPVPDPDCHCCDIGASSRRHNPGIGSGIPITPDSTNGPSSAWPWPGPPRPAAAAASPPGWLGLAG